HSPRPTPQAPNANPQTAPRPAQGGRPKAVPDRLRRRAQLRAAGHRGRRGRRIPRPSGIIGGESRKRRLDEPRLALEVLGAESPEGPPDDGHARFGKEVRNALALADPEVARTGARDEERNIAAPEVVAFDSNDPG